MSQAPQTSGIATDPAQWLERALHVLTLRLRHEVALTRALRGDERREGFLGLLLSDGEAERLLDEMSGRLAAEGGIAALEEIAAARAALGAERRRDRHGIWPRLATAFDLAEPELEILVLAAAPALDPRFGRVYGYLNDDLTRRHLTPALVQRLIGADLDALTVRRVLADDAPLVRFGLIRADASVPVVERALRIDEGLLDPLLGAPPVAPGPLLAFGAGVLPGRSLLVTGRGGAQTSVATLDAAAERGWHLCLVPDGRDPASMRSAVSAARLAGTVPVLSGLDGWAAESMRALAPLLSSGVVLLTARPEAWLAAGVHAEVLTAAAVSHLRRREWTSRLLARPVPDRLAALLANARHLDLLRLAAAATGDLRSLEIALRAQVSAGLTDFAQPIETTQTLEDLVLPRAARVGLERLVSWPSTGARLLEDWGLGPVFGKRPGIVALFKGASGTGKTMAAGVVASALGLPAFRVDLAAMVSKYIGETEKNLEHLFAAAEETDSLIFFDEADSVFGQRSEVSDARDRYANLETSYLLQRLEGFDGIAVLATNLAQNMDPAFLRRIDVVVDFPSPDADQRRALWRRGTRSAAPLAADLDLDLVAERFELTGGEIRNCWLDAAQRAAAGSGVLGMPEVMRAVAAELVKQGKPLRKTDFGAYYGSSRGVP
jgi:hypothetical protein